MLERGSKRQDVLLGAEEVARSQKQSSQRNEDIPTPAPSPSRREMRKSSSEGRRGLSRIQRRRFDHTVHLDGAQRQVMRERVASGDELRTLFDGGTSGGFVRFGHDDGEELGSQERRRALLDTFKSFFEPLGGLRKAREHVQLSIK